MQIIWLKTAFRNIDELAEYIVQENWQAVMQRIHAQLPCIPLWYEGQFTAMQKNITNYSPKPDGNWDDLATITEIII